MYVMLPLGLVSVYVEPAGARSYVPDTGARYAGPGAPGRVLRTAGVGGSRARRSGRPCSIGALPRSVLGSRWRALVARRQTGGPCCRIRPKWAS